MAIDPSVRIDIAAEFVGKKAFKQADTATGKLNNNVKNLAKTFGLAFSTAAVLGYAKASIRAAAADQKAQEQLKLALTNVGLSRDAASAENYIQSIEKELGIIDDKLRPAYVKLAIATRDTAKTQKLLGIALDISASTGKDLEAVTASLSKGFLGNNTALGRLGIGISKADLKTKSFKQITEQLAATFAGAAQKSADSFSGTIDKLSIATNNAKEIIGVSLINALKSLGEDKSIDALSGDIEGASKSLANFIDAIVFLKGELNSLPGAGVFKYLASGVTDLLGRFSPQRLVELIKLIKGQGGPTGGFTDSQNSARLAADKIAAASAKAAAAAAAKAAKVEKLTSASKLQTEKLAAAARKKADIAAAALAKAAALFDINKIQIAAALKATFDKDERLRLLAMQEIENGNGEAALKYVEQLKLLTAEQQTNKLAGINAISQLELSSINKLLLDELARIAATKMTQEQADELRAEAYRKYNAAIIASGGLADANFYNDKTQIELVQIARLAALDKVATAQATFDLLNYTSQTDIIARVAAAQKLADDAKYRALQDYLALLGKQLPTPAAPTMPSPGSEPITPGFYGDTYDYSSLIPAAASSGGTITIDNSVVVNIEGLLDQGGFDDIINKAILDNIRRGMPQTPAGFLRD